MQVESLGIRIATRVRLALGQPARFVIIPLSPIAWASLSLHRRSAQAWMGWEGSWLEPPLA